MFFCIVSLEYPPVELLTVAHMMMQTTDDYREYKRNSKKNGVSRDNHSPPAVGGKRKWQQQQQQPPKTTDNTIIPSSARANNDKATSGCGVEKEKAEHDGGRRRLSNKCHEHRSSWTIEQHRLFSAAIFSIGAIQACPLSILGIMNPKPAPSSEQTNVAAATAKGVDSKRSSTTINSTGCIDNDQDRGKTTRKCTISKNRCNADEAQTATKTLTTRSNSKGGAASLTSARVKSHLQKFRMNQEKWKKNFISDYARTLQQLCASSQEKTSSLSRLDKNNQEQEEEEAAARCFYLTASSETGLEAIASGEAAATVSSSNNKVIVMQVPRLTSEEMCSANGAVLGFCKALVLTLQAELMCVRSCATATKEVLPEPQHEHCAGISATSMHNHSHSTCDRDHDVINTTRIAPNVGLQERLLDGTYHECPHQGTYQPFALLADPPIASCLPSLLFHPAKEDSSLKHQQHSDAIYFQNQQLEDTESKVLPPASPTPKSHHCKRQTTSSSIEGQQMGEEEVHSKDSGEISDHQDINNTYIDPENDFSISDSSSFAAPDDLLDVLLSLI
jgi:hypothetical protein